MSTAQRVSRANVSSWSEFCRLVLKIIAELSPCSESTLLMAAAYRGLERFGDGSIGDLRKLLGQCVQELQARGVVEIDGEHLVIAPAGSAEDEEMILELTTLAEIRQNEDILELTDVAGRADEEDILELTAELELNSSLRRSNRGKLDETPGNQKQLQTTQVSGGPEHGPEPTREEIIAAMRRLVSKD